MIVVVDKNGNIKMKVTSVVVSASSSSPTSAQFASVVQHISAISAEVATKNDIITLQNAGSNFVSNPTAINFRGTGVSSHLSAGVAIVDITAGGGGGSVTSAEYISLVDRVSGNSAQMTSADNAISNAVSIVSAAQAATSADLTSVKGVVSVLSQAVSVISVALSVLSARVDSNSTQMASADTALYQAVSVISQQVSVLSARVASNSAQMTSADDAISNAVSVVSAAQAATSAAVTSVNNRVSALSADLTSFKQSLNNIGDVSVPSPSDGQALIFSSAAAQWIAQSVAAGSGSVTSAEYLSLVDRVSGNSAQMTSADNAISNAVSIVSVAQAATSAAVTSVNNRISALGAVGNTVFVSKDGNDGTGAREKFNLPFLTISAAITAATSGDTIIVYPGTYSETLTLKDGVNFYFYDGVTITAAAAAAITDNNVAVTCEIDGYGVIESTGTASAYNCVDVQNTGTTLTIIGKLIHSEYRGVEAKGTLKIYCDILCDNTNAQEGIRMNGALCNLTFRGDVSTLGYGIMASSTTIYQNTADIKGNLFSQTNSPLAIYGATVKFEGTTLSSEYFGLEMAEGTLYARNSTFQSTTAVAGDGHAFVEYGVDDGDDAAINFDNCVFLAGPNSDSINKMSGASGARIYFLTACYANRPIDTSGAVPNIYWGRTNLNIITENDGFAQLNLSSKVVADQLAQGALTSGFIVGAVGSVPTWVSAGTIVSVTSAEHVSLADRVSAVSADLTSFKQSINNIGDVSVPSPGDGQVLTFNSAAAQWIATSVAAGSGSVTSAEYLSLVDRVSVNSAQMTSADNAISNAVSIVSAAQAVTSAAVTSVNNRVSAISADVTSVKNLISVISQQVSVLSARVEGNSAQMTSADNAISQAVSIVSVAQAATSAAVTSVNNRVSAISTDLTSFKQSLNNIGDVSVPTPGDGQVLTFNSAAQQWIATSVAAGSGSVTSAEYLSLVDRVSVNSAQMTSADNAISNAVSIVSAAQAATSAAVTSVNNRVSAVSTDITSIRGVVENLSNNLSAAINRPPWFMRYQYTDSTVIDDPGAGLFLLNNATIGSATEMAISFTDQAGNNLEEWIISLDNSIQSGVRAVMYISNRNVITNWFKVTITSAITNNTTWANFSIVVDNATGSFSDADEMFIGFVTADQNISNIFSAIAANSAQMTSADNAISNAVSIVSVAQAATSAAVTSVNQVISALSARVAANSAQMTSADNNLASIVSTLVNKPYSNMNYVFNSATTIDDPGAGIIRFNNTNQALATEIAVNTTDNSGNDFKNWWTDIALYNQAIRGVLTLSKISDPNVFRETLIIGDLVDNGTWVQVSVLSQNTNGVLTSADRVYLTFHPADPNVSATLAAITSINQAVSAISNAVSIVSAAQAVTSAAVTSVNNRVSSVSADLTSFKQSINNFGDVSIASPADQQVLVYNSAAGQWLNSTLPGGSGSVTSAEYISLVDRVSAISTDVTSIRSVVSSLSTRLSALSTQVTNNSAQMTSADNAISQAVSVVSVAQAATSAAVTSVNNRISAISADLTSVQARVSANSAQMTSADNAISNAVSIVSAAQAATSAAVTSVNNRISAVSADLTSFKQSINNFGDVSIASPADQQVLVYNSAAGQWLNSTLPGGSGSVTSAEYVSLVSIVSAIRYPAIESVTSAVYSVVDADNGKVKYFNNAASIEVVLPNGLTSGFQAIIYRGVSAGPIRFSAATSVEAQGSALNDTRTAATIINRGSDLWIALGAFLPAELGDVVNRVSILSNAVSVLSQSVSVLSQAVSVLSQNVSVLSVAVAALTPPQAKVVAGVQSIAVSTLTDISGLSVVFSANGIYEIHAHVIYEMRTSASNTKFGFSSPGAVAVHGFVIGDVSATNGPPMLTTARAAGGFFYHNSASESIIVSTGSVVTTLGTHGFIMDALVVSANAGTMQLMAAPGTATAPLTILGGSYIKAFKIG